MSGCSVVVRNVGIEAGQALLLIGLSHKDCAHISQGVDDAQWCIQQVKTRQAALSALAKHAPSIIICACQFEDGVWKDILALALELSPTPPVIVASRTADEYLWAEVLNFGGYDVLALPFDPEEVKRVTQAALRVAGKQSEGRRHKSFSLTPIIGNQSR